MIYLKDNLTAFVEWDVNVALVLLPEHPIEKYY